MQPITNLTGKRFGRLKVLEDTGERKNTNVVWRCICSCGQLTMVMAHHLKSGQTKSCGCLRQDVMRKTAYKHGDCCNNLRSRLYLVWDSMKKRCYMPTEKAYKNYGKRGIKICDEWRNDYSTFRFWAILNGYQDNLTIDRINNDGNYEPSNCQWLTKSENSKKKYLDRRPKL